MNSKDAFESHYKNLSKVLSFWGRKFSKEIQLWQIRTSITDYAFRGQHETGMHQQCMLDQGQAKAELNTFIHDTFLVFRVPMKLTSGKCSSHCVRMIVSGMYSLLPSHMLQAKGKNIKCVVVVVVVVSELQSKDPTNLEPSLVEHGFCRF